MSSVNASGWRPEMGGSESGVMPTTTGNRDAQGRGAFVWVYGVMIEGVT